MRRARMATVSEKFSSRVGCRALWAAVLHKAILDACDPPPSQLDHVGLEWFYGDECAMICEHLDLIQEELADLMRARGIQESSSRPYQRTRRDSITVGGDVYVCLRLALATTGYKHTKSLYAWRGREDGVKVVPYRGRNFYKLEDLKTLKKWKRK